MFERQLRKAEHHSPRCHDQRCRCELVAALCNTLHWMAPRTLLVSAAFSFALISAAVCFVCFALAIGGAI